jgi:surface antigen
VIKHTLTKVRYLLPVLILLCSVGMCLPARPAHADTTTYQNLGYPHADMPCEHSPYSTTGSCANYDWGPVHDGSQASTYSSRGYGYRNCTDYVAWKLQQYSVPNAKTSGLGNGGQWADNAHINSLAWSTTPKAGTAAVVPGNPGHVAFVESVNSDGTITVSEYNHDAKGDGDMWTGNPSSRGFSKYVDFGVNITSTSNVDAHILRTKKKVANDGAQQVYSATSSDVFESWWYNGGNGVHTSSLAHIPSNNIVDMDKVNQPDGVTQNLYTAVSDGVYETWWRPGDGPHTGKIINLANVKRITATISTANNQTTHLLYVLASDGPYEYWWQDGGDGIHSSRLTNIIDPVAFVKTTAPNGEDELYTATVGGVWESKWYPGQGITTTQVMGISQNNIQDIDKVSASDGTEVLWTAVPDGVWQAKWNGSSSITYTKPIVNQTNVKRIEARMQTSSQYQLYMATGDHVQETI